MSLNSSRLAIANGLVYLLTNVQNPNTSAALYQGVKLGSVFDPSSFTGLWCEVVYASGKSGPAGSGGNLIGWRIEDNPIFAITTGCDYETDSTAAMTNILTAMDVLLPMLHSHYQVPNANSPSAAIASIYSLLEAPQNDRGQPVRYPNGKIYYLWTTYWVCKQQYNVQIVNP